MEEGDVRRRGSVAALLGVLTTGLGHVYIGRPWEGLGYFLALLVSMLGLTVLMGNWRFGFPVTFLVSASVWLAAIFMPAIYAWRRKVISKSRRPRLWYYAAFYFGALALGWGYGAILPHVIPYKIFSIPSAAMSPNVLAGDYVVVKKFLDADQKLQIEPGAIIVFWNEESKGDPASMREYVKRVVATGGQEVRFKQGVVHIDDVALPQEYLDTIELGKGFAGAQRAQVLTEVNGASHYSIYDIDLGSGRLDNVGPYQVPEGHYFVLGDNRDRSLDSRVVRAVGYVAAEDVIGEALYVAWSFKDLSRIGKRLD
jgi:signal peptidase I